MAPKHRLVEVDSIDIAVIVDNEVDPLTPSQSPHVGCPGGMMGVSLTPLPPTARRVAAAAELLTGPASCSGGAGAAEFRMDSICNGAHGLSLMITARQADKKHTLLFDAGPEEEIFERNITRLRLDPSAIEHVHLSNWSREHSGGLLRAIDMIEDGKQDDAAATPEEPERVVVEVHPDRPDCRGMKGCMVVSFESDPTFDEIEEAGAVLEKRDDVHAVLDDMFLVSGEIPRQTSYEGSTPGGLRFSEETGKWTSDELIKDERFVMCNLKGKGLAVFTGCSNAGVVNVCRHALEIGGGAPLFAVVGGFHLADATPERLQQSIEDLKSLGPKVLMPGHCTGWRFKFKAESEIPGLLVPCFSGSQYTLTGDF